MVVAIYLLIGALLGFLWHRSELGRSPLRRLLPSLCAFVLAWPVLVAGSLAMAALWTLIWRRSHRADPAIAAAPRSA